MRSQKDHIHRPATRRVRTCLLLLLFASATRAEVPVDPPGAISSSWLANTYMDMNGNKNVTEELNDLAVSPNGHVFSAGYAETWGGGASYAASDGSFRYRYDNFATGFGDPVSNVAADDTYVYWGSPVGILRSGHDGGGNGSYTTFLSGTNIAGLCIHSGKLYVSDFSNGRVRRLDLTTMQEEFSFACDRPTRLAVAANGSIYVVIYDPASVQPLSEGPMWWGEKVRSFSAAGAAGAEITDFEKPLGIAIDGNGQLLVGGLNANSQIWEYSITGAAPVKSGTLGAAGGIFSGARGAFTSSAKLHWVRSIAVDASGNVYTGCVYGSFWGDCVEKWDAAGNLQWRVFAGTSLDCGGIDPDNETEVYSKFHHYRLDYSKTAPGTEWSLVGFTVDRFTYPNDNRVDQNTDVGSRSLGGGAYRIGGKLFVVRTNQEGYRWELYHQETAGGSEVLVPSVAMGAGGDGSNHFYDPVTKTWEERPKKFVNGDKGYNQYWDIARNGDIFTLIDTGSPWTIVRYPFGGLDAKGNPLWEASTATSTPAPEFTDWGDVRRIQYDSDADVMYLAGHVQAYDFFGTNHEDGRGSFTQIKKFPNWLAGNRVSAFTVSLPYVDEAYTPDLWFGAATPVAFCAEGDYLFVLYGYGHIRILRKSDGGLVGTLVQNVANGWHGGKGQVDCAYGMTVHKRATGEYVLLFENAAWGNIMLTRWTPPSDHAGGTNVAPTVSAGGNQSVVLPATADLAGSVSDDGLPSHVLNVTWSVLSGAGPVTFADANAASTTASFGVAGTYVLRLSASDGSLTAAADTTITVGAEPTGGNPPNVAPTVSAGADQTIILPATASLVGSASDDGLPANALMVTWSAHSGPGAVAFAQVDSAATTATFSVAGTYVLRLTASDGALTSSSDATFTVLEQTGATTGGHGGGGKGCGTGSGIAAFAFVVCGALLRLRLRAVRTLSTGPWPGREGT